MKHKHYASLKMISLHGGATQNVSRINMSLGRNGIGYQQVTNGGSNSVDCHILTTCLICFSKIPNPSESDMQYLRDRSVAGE